MLCIVSFYFWGLKRVYMKERTVALALCNMFSAMTLHAKQSNKLQGKPVLRLAVQERVFLDCHSNYYLYRSIGGRM